MDINDWIEQVINGTGGFKSWEQHECIAHSDRDKAIASFESYQITNFAKTCYIIQSPEPPLSLQKTNGVLDVDKGRVDSTLVLIRLDIEAQPIDTILTFIKKNY